jgi:hypothetical protein
MNLNTHTFKLIELESNELDLVNGGDKAMHDFGQFLGFWWQEFLERMDRAAETQQDPYSHMNRF